MPDLPSLYAESGALITTIVMLVGALVWAVRELMNEKKNHLETTKEILPIAEDMKSTMESAVKIVEANTREIQIERAVRERGQ